MREPVALLSVRPRFAEALLNGSKTVEIRRRKAHIADGAICLVYASSPVRALVGAVSVRATDTDLPEALWGRWGAYTGLQRDEYDDYLKDSVKACAIVVSDAVSFPRPVNLSELRRRHRNFVTPQSYRFLGTGELTSLLNGEAAHLARLADAGQSARI
jgi:predicted transcriptional regulator